MNAIKFLAIASLAILGCGAPSEPEPTGVGGSTSSAASSSTADATSTGAGGAVVSPCPAGDPCSDGDKAGTCSENGECCTGCLENGRCNTGYEQDACGGTGVACRSCFETQGCNPSSRHCETTCSRDVGEDPKCEEPRGSCVGGFCQCNGCVAYDKPSGTLVCVEVCPTGAVCHNGTCAFGL